MSSSPAAGAATPARVAGRADARGRRRRTVAVSVACSVLGPLLFLVLVGVTLEEDPPLTHPVLWGLLLAVDVSVGLALGVLAGPLRTSRAGALTLVVVSTLSTWALPAGVVGVVRLGMRRSWRLDAVVLAVLVGGGGAVATLQAYAAGLPAPTPVELLALLPVAAALLLWGRLRGTRAALVESLREQAATAERERAALAQGREAEIARTRAEERTAIARDMHDTLSHRLSLVAMHAGALAYRDDLPPERVREAARTVRDAAGDAGAVLREVLVTLRSPEVEERLGHAGGAEPPTVSVDVVVARARAAGAVVDVVRRGVSATDLEERSPATAVSLCQMLSELLDNAVRHAPGAPVEVVLEHDGEDLVLRVTNPVRVAPDATASGTGLGLVGVGERARLLGGGVRHGVVGADEETWFAVEVRVPWQR